MREDGVSLGCARVRPAWPSSRWGLCPLWDRGSGAVSRTEGWAFLGEPWGQHSDHSLCAAQVQENSPAQQAGLEPYFDFIITIGHSRLVRPPSCLCCVCVCVRPSVHPAVAWEPQPWRPNPISPFFQGNSEPDGGPAWSLALGPSGVGRRQGDSWHCPQSLQSCPEG